MKMTHTDTSEAALASLEPHLERLERLVLLAIEANGRATCDEIEQETGLSHQSASARLTALKNRELICATDERRKTRSGRKAICWQRWGLI